MSASQSIQIQKLLARLRAPPTSEAEGLELIHLLDSLIEASDHDERRWFLEAKGRYLTDFPFGDPTLRAELAIEALTESVESLSKDAQAERHATAHQIALSFHLRRAGTARENMEAALKWASQSLAGATSKTDWRAVGEAHLILGETYLARLAGERIENLTNAETHYIKATSEFAKIEDEHGYSRANLGLANTLLKPVLRNRAERRKRALHALEQVTAYAPKSDIAIKTQAYMLKGVALASQPRSNGDQDVIEAIAAFRTTSGLARLDGQLAIWAQAQHNLGNAWLDLKSGKATLNIGRAIVHLKRAVIARGQDGLTHHHAMSLNSLGTAYWEARASGDRYLNLAREALELATDLRIRLGRTDDAFGSAHNLTRVLAAQCAWPKITVLCNRLLEQNATFLKNARDPAEAERLVSAMGRIVDMMALASLKEQGAEQALSLIAKTRSRLRNDDNEGAVRDVGPGELLATVLMPLPPEPMHLIFRFWGIDGELRTESHELEGFSQDDLEAFLYGGSNQPAGWLQAYHLLQRNNDRSLLEHVLGEIPQTLRPLLDLIKAKTEGLGDIKKISLAATGALTILPLASTPQLLSHPVSLVGSHHRENSKPRAPFSGRVVSFSDPDSTLPFGRLEGLHLRSVWPDTELYEGNEATLKTAMRVLSSEEPVSLIHISGHGRFVWSNPSNSHLQMSDGKLTVDAIRSLPQLNGAPIVILSACEVGITDYRNLPTENFGFPSIWLNAGARAVVAPLWPVNDGIAHSVTTRIFDAFLDDIHLSAALRSAREEKSDAKETPADTINRWTTTSKHRSSTPEMDVRSFQVFTR